MVVDFNKNKITIVEGSTLRLVAEVSPKNAICREADWVSSNLNSAYILKDDLRDNSTVAIVQGKNLGKTTITATVWATMQRTDIYKQNMAAKDTCEITVGTMYTTSEVQNRTTDGFAGWYNPGTGYIGVNHRVPRFVQMGPGPCLGYCIMMADHYLRYRGWDKNTFFTKPPHSYFNTDGEAQWENTGYPASAPSNFGELSAVLRAQLDLGKPVVVSGHNGTYPHYALVVGYTGSGVNPQDFVAIDPLYNKTGTGYPQFPTTYSEFKRNFKGEVDANRPIYLFNDFNYPL